MTPSRFHALVRGEARGAAAGLARAGLWWARLPYGAAVRLRNRLFDLGLHKPTRAPVPVVSVGNLTLGGTGKTPCVEYVAGFYRDLGLRVAVLSRGYGSEAGRNDEAMVLEENLPDVPHLQGPDRAALALTAAEELDSEVLVLDDGFQHRRLARNLDIVLIDSTRPFWHDYLFPRGTLREPVSSLRRADVVIVTRCEATSTGADPCQEAVTRLRELFPGKLVLTSGHIPTRLVRGDGRTEELATVRGRPVAAFCGIGNPDAFEATVFMVTGGPMPDRRTWFRTYPDHHNYTRADVDDLRAWAATLPDDAVILTTQKDLVKLRLTELAGRPLWAVRIEFRILGSEPEFHERLRAVAPKLNEG
jgi:tetraacyldisaccharide 4'-kinase